MAVTLTSNRHPGMAITMTPARYSSFLRGRAAYAPTAHQARVVRETRAALCSGGDCDCGGEYTVIHGTTPGEIPSWGSIEAEHRALIHADGSPCLDGCGGR
jgi:hypothetical protein